ncbi:MAG: SLBB domain-containing protein, partial [Bacteroidota bacterium]
MASQKTTQNILSFRFFSVLLLSLIVAQAGVQSQTREQVRAEAEGTLQRMTPAEIEQKLKDLGLTRDEAVAKAREYGISLEDYLSRLRLVQEGEPGTLLGRGDQQLRSDPRLGAHRPSYIFLGDLDTLVAGKRLPKARQRIPVPGFEARYGVDSLLQPYGFDLFQNESTFFTPSQSAAPPPSYALGPGDEITITLWGETRYSFQGVVNREGNLVVPDVGPVSASGLTLLQFQSKLLNRMSSVYASLLGGPRARTHLDVSLGKLKNIQIFVTGEVMRPGGYSIPSMSTILTALYAAGGPTISGSMRNIHIIRRGEKHLTADLYEYLLRMETASDQHLMDGDIIFVGPAVRRVALVGAVVREAIYEVADAETLGDLLRMAGGLRFSASTKRAYLERIVPFRERKLYDKDLVHFNLEFPSVDDLLASKEKLENGDVVRIFTIDYLPYNRVDIAGPVYKPGRYALTPGMRVADLIHIADSLRRSTFAERGTVSRLLPDLRREILPFNLRRALEGDGNENLLLKNEDSVIVYAESLFYPQRNVTITGAVRWPGKYLRREQMTVGDLIVMAGGLTESGTVSGIEVARMDTVEVGKYSKVYKVDLPRDYWTGGAEDFLLSDHDIVSIHENPKYTPPKSVVITGYVMLPGTYAIRYSGERLADLFRRSGGLRVGAYLEGSRLFRKFNNAGLVPLNFNEALADESSRDNVVLYDGDS